MAKISASKATIVIVSLPEHTEKYPELQAAAQKALKEPKSPPPGPLASLPVGIHRVAITAFIKDPALQARLRTNPELTNQYATAIRSGAVFPPVTLARIGGAAFLVAGWHRTAAHEQAGETHIRAEIIDTSMKQAKWLSAASNLTHGRPASGADKRRAFKAFIMARRHIKPGTAGKLLTYAEIALALHGACGGTGTMFNWMKKDFPKIAQKMSRGDWGDKGNENGTDTGAGHLRAALAAIEEIEAREGGIRRPEQREKLQKAVAGLYGRLVKATPGDEFDNDDDDPGEGPETE